MTTHRPVKRSRPAKSMHVAIATVAVLALQSLTTAYAATAVSAPAAVAVTCSSNLDGYLQGTITGSKTLVATGQAAYPAATAGNLRLGDGCCMSGSGSAACCASPTAYDTLFSCSLPAAPTGKVLSGAIITLTVVNVVGYNPLTWNTWSRTGPSKAVLDFVRDMQTAVLCFPSIPADTSSELHRTRLCKQAPFMYHFMFVCYCVCLLALTRREGGTSKCL